MGDDNHTAEQLRGRLAELSHRLEEAEETIAAIRSGAVDAFLVEGLQGERVYALETADRPYRLLVECMNEGAITLALDGTILYCNPRFVDLLQTSREAVTGRHLCELVRPEEQDVCESLLEAAKNAPAQGEILLPRSDGTTVPVHLTLSPLPLEGGAAVCAIVTDLTEHKHNVQLRITQAALRESEARYRKADRQKDEFLAILAHELRNPLAPATNALHILKMKAPPIPELQWAQDILATQVQRMTRLIDDLMDVSRITSGKLTLRKERVALSRIVEEALSSSRPLIEQSEHELIVSLPRDPVFLEADVVRIAQVLSNLLNNAAKYTNAGGRIWLTAARKGGEIALSIKDTGIGIPPELLPQVFELFMQVDRSLTRSHSGLGIGLTLVKRLVEMHGGTVEARSEGTGKGSEFILRLPAPVEATETAQDPTRKTQSAPTSGRRILVVDDNELSADSMSVLLGLAGNQTRTAYDGIQALELAEEFRPDVVLLDLGLPLLDGYETCARIRKQAWGKDIIVIALTGWGQEEDRRRSQAAGFDHHIVKPANPVDLMNLLAETRTAKEREGGQAGHT